MAEKRKPSSTILLRKSGKKNQKIELFDSNLWGDGKPHNFSSRSRCKRFRLRINGKWFDVVNKGVKKYLTTWEFRDLLWRSIKF